MNERIKKLWDDAALEAGDESNTWDGQVAFMALFAELIVRECASVAARTSCPYTDDYMVKQFGHTWDMACVESAKEITKHFGVEK